MPVIPALGKLRQEDYEFEARLSYKVKPVLKKEKKKKRKKKKKGLKSVTCLRKPEREEQTKLKSSRREEIMKIVAGLNMKYEIEK
jgi:hypothetical protein